MTIGPVIGYNRHGVAWATLDLTTLDRMPTYSSSSLPTGRLRPQLQPQAEPSDDRQERLIPFPSAARSNGEPEQVARRRRDEPEADRKPSRPRRARRRRQETPWLQRNALSVAAVSVLVALLGLGFGLLQMINRPEPVPALLAIGQTEPTAVSGSTLNASLAGPGVQLGPAPGASTTAPPSSSARQVQATHQVLESNYTVAAGDTLGQIATRFNTSVERIQALNNLVDPRALRIGTKLVIPPPL